VQVFPYSPGALYQVYVAPGQVADIAPAPGEQLTGAGPVASRDGGFLARFGAHCHVQLPASTLTRRYRRLRGFLQSAAQLFGETQT